MFIDQPVQPATKLRTHSPGRESPDPDFAIGTGIHHEMESDVIRLPWEFHQQADQFSDRRLCATNGAATVQLLSSLHLMELLHVGIQRFETRAENLLVERAHSVIQLWGSLNTAMHFSSIAIGVGKAVIPNVVRHGCAS